MLTLVVPYLHFFCSQLNYSHIKFANGRTVSDTNICLVGKTSNRQNETQIFKATHIINLPQKPTVYIEANFMTR